MMSSDRPDRTEPEFTMDTLSRALVRPNDHLPDMADAVHDRIDDALPAGALDTVFAAVAVGCAALAIVPFAGWGAWALSAALLVLGLYAAALRYVRVGGTGRDRSYHNRLQDATPDAIRFVMPAVAVALVIASATVVSPATPVGNWVFASIVTSIGLVFLLAAWCQAVSEYEDLGRFRP